MSIENEYIIIQNVTGLLKESQICMTKPEFLQSIKDMCISMTSAVPIRFLIVALILDFIEYFTREHFNKKEYARNTILFELGFYNMTTSDIVLIISVAKTLSIITAMVLLFYGVNAWG